MAERNWPPGQMTNARVQFISLVDKAANGRQFKIFKSEDEGEEMEGQQNQTATTGTVTTAVQLAATATQEPVQTEPQAEEIRGFFQTLKAFFTRGLVQKTDTPVGPYGADEMVRVEKIGKKVSGKRLKLLKDAFNNLQAALADLEAEETANEGGEMQVTKEELAQVVSAEIQKAVKPLEERVAKLETPATNEQKPENGPLTPEKVAEIVGAEVKKAVDPIAARVERLEQARGAGNAQQPEVQVQKNDGFDWGGAFLGGE